MKTILNWNIYMGGGKRVPSILRSIEDIDPDIAVLTEFRSNKRGEEVRIGLEALGLSHSVIATAEPNENSVAIFSKDKFVPFKIEGDVSELTKRVVAGDFDGVNVIAWYYPQSWLRGDYLQFTMEGLSEYRESKTFLIGDFNVGCIGQDGFTGKYGVVENCFSEATSLWCDIWRSRNKGAMEFSWYSHAGNGFRIDHMLGSELANELVNDIWYKHDVREEKVSDHSQMICTINP